MEEEVVLVEVYERENERMMIFPYCVERNLASGSWSLHGLLSNFRAATEKRSRWISPPADNDYEDKLAMHHRQDAEAATILDFH